MKSIYSSGNEIVDEIAEMNFTGNLIPAEWYRTLVGKDNKPKLLAINILADFVYWYRPIEQREEATGAIVGYRKKFKADLLQRSYRQIEEQFGISKKQARGALDFLCELGAIKRVLRDETTKEGVKLHNVMYIELVPKKVKELTFPLEGGGVPSRELPCAAGGTMVDTYRTYGIATKGSTNTENITKTSTDNKYQQKKSLQKRNKFSFSYERGYSDEDIKELERRIFVN